MISVLAPYCDSIVHVGDHTELPKSDVCFVLGYTKIIPKAYLDLSNKNLVVHESRLPDGKGFSPMSWQILQGKDEITFSLIEAESEVDSGAIFIQKTVSLEGFELYDDWRSIQFKTTLDMCAQYLIDGESLNPVRQVGEGYHYPKRTPADSELKVGKTIEEQFNLLRIVDNESFPAFFYYLGKKYVIKIYQEAEL